MLARRGGSFALAWAGAGLNHTCRLGSRLMPRAAAVLWPPPRCVEPHPGVPPPHAPSGGHWTGGHPGDGRRDQHAGPRRPGRALQALLPAGRALCQVAGRPQGGSPPRGPARARARTPAHPHLLAARAPASRPRSPRREARAAGARGRARWRARVRRAERGRAAPGHAPQAASTSHAAPPSGRVQHNRHP